MLTIKLNKEELGYLDSILHDPEVRISFWQKILAELDQIQQEEGVKMRDENLLNQVRQKIASFFK